MKIREIRNTVLMVPILFLAGCSGNSESGEKGPDTSSVNTSIVEVLQVVGVGKVEPETEIVSLAAVTGGVVRKLNHNEGDTIKKGEIIVQLDDELEVITVARYRSQFMSQKSQKEVDVMNLKDSEIRLANKERLLKSVTGLVDKGAETKQTLDDLETDVAVLRLTVDRNRAMVTLAESRLQEMAEQMRFAEAESGRKTLRSPYDGVLLDIHVNEGQALSQFEPYAEVAPSGAMTVRTEVDELFADRLTNGLDAEIRFIGSDSLLTTGKVIFVSPYLKKKSLFSGKVSEQEDRLVREVRIKIEESASLILSSKVEVVIKLNGRQS